MTKTVSQVLSITGHILRNPEQGSIIKDIIAESEGEKIPRLTFTQFQKASYAALVFKYVSKIISLSPGHFLLRMSDLLQ